MFFARQLPILLFLISLSGLSLAKPCHAQEQWQAVDIPSIWRRPPAADKGADLGFAWYRCQLDVPAEWQQEKVSLFVESADDAREVYLNGVLVAALGAMPPKYRSGLGSDMEFQLKPQHLLFGKPNVLAIRTFRNSGRTNFNLAAPVLAADKQAIRTAGKWQYRAGDDRAWTLWQDDDAEGFLFNKVADREQTLVAFRKLENDRGILPPQEALAGMKTPEGLAVQLVLSDPDIGQPLSLKFDSRGRLWVVEYRQYPNPAGLKMVSRDKYLRAVYDKMPLPPPNHFPGQDRITIHEDTDGDGIYDKHKTFLDGLSLVTSFAIGRGGVWVLNPPYLLFYPDNNGDDVPDGNPDVHLQGFGMEDSHSIANSMRWGPDGWLYASQGSTVSGKIRPYQSKQAAVYSMGQLIWRYHPLEKKYEVFAEGGGNSFGVEFDANGHVYSGHNGGNTRGFHYVQGGYYQKGFAKHGALSNPFTFGYFPHMAHHQVPRFTHTFVINEAPGWPAQYQRALMGVAPLQGHVVASTLEADGSTYKTTDFGHPLTTDDSWFRPVDIQMGPDGSAYVADMYEQRIDHASHYQGRVHTTSGRIYRLHAGHQPIQLDLAASSTAELVQLLSHPNKWHRQTALRLLADRRDPEAIALLNDVLDESLGLTALNACWGLHVVGGLTDGRSLQLLSHKDPQVRAWTVRLICDNHQATVYQVRSLVALATRESDLQVRSQLACSARRLRPEAGVAIIRQLLQHSEDADDPHIPLLLWWAVEEHVEARQAIVSLMKGPLWTQPLVQQHIIERLMRRLALTGSQADLMAAAILLESAPDDASRGKLLSGFEQAYEGRSLVGLPARLLEAIAASGGGSLKLKLRLNDNAAIETALAQIQDSSVKSEIRQGLVSVFGQIDCPRAVPVLLTLVADKSDLALAAAALTSLQSYTAEEIAIRVIELYSDLPAAVRPAAESLLASRPAWTRLWLAAIQETPAFKQGVPLSTVRRMLLHNDKQSRQAIGEIWGKVEGATTAEMKQRIEHYASVVNLSDGNPYNGRALFIKHCGACHTLFDRGGEIGPNLTTYKRDDLQNMLLNIVNPSIEIRKGFENFVVFTDDGRTLNGFIEEQDNRVVVLKGIDGQRIVIPRAQIDEMAAVSRSIMPEGILKPLSEQQVRDLFAFLRASQPLP
jgi:putative membrane-bound dehydrogenase-like protein